MADYEYRNGKSASDGSTTASDGHTYYGCVFGGGSGYFPYEIKNDLGQYTAQTRILEAQAKFLGDLADKADIKVTKEFELDKAIAAEQAKKAEAETAKDKVEASSSQEEAKQPQAKQMK